MRKWYVIGIIEILISYGLNAKTKFAINVETLANCESRIYLYSLKFIYNNHIVLRLKLCGNILKQSIYEIYN